MSQKYDATVFQPRITGEPSPVLDTITIYESETTVVNKKTSYLCYTVYFPAEGPDQARVLDLVCAANALRQLAPHYTVFPNMSYWRAINICRLLAQKRKYHIEKHRAATGS